MNKDHKVRCSAWGSKKLSPAQIEYAALDAWIALEIFNSVSTAAGDKDIEDVYKRHVDTRDTYAKPVKVRQPNGPPTIDLTKEGKHPIRKSQLYYNCQLMSPEGYILCKCDLKKVQWYLDRNLGEIVQEDPLTLKLKFDPKGKGHAGDPYYMSAKENKCVGCGSTELLSKHSIIPHSYRCHLPTKYKSRTSHDIVLLCQRCQYTMTLTVGTLKNSILRELSAHLPPLPAKKFVVDSNIAKARAAGTALRKNTDNTIPPKRVAELTQVIKNFYQKEDITEDDILKASKLDPRQELQAIQENEQPITEDEAIAKHISSKGEQAILEFVIRWRQNFLSTLRPTHMPQHWDVNHDFSAQN